MTATQQARTGAQDCAVLFVNGLITDYARLDSWVAPDAYRVGVNGGTRHCLHMDMVPDVIIGDLDSLPQTLRQQLEAAAVSFLTYPAAKDQTDLELAIHHVLAQGIRTMVFLGMWGGRLDQSLTNLLLMARYAQAAQMTLVTEHEIVRILSGAEQYRVAGHVGATLSLCPLSPQVEGVTLAGMEFPLHNALLTLGTSLGISNRVTADPALVSVRQGQLLVVVSRD